MAIEYNQKGIASKKAKQPGFYVEPNILPTVFVNYVKRAVRVYKRKKAQRFCYAFL